MNVQLHRNVTSTRGESAPPPDSAAASDWPDVAGYQLHQLIRRTRANEVYLAFSRAARGWQELTVVQRLPGVDPAELRRAVEAEVAAAARVPAHPGLAPVAAVGLTADGRLYVASERPTGRTLSEVLAAEGALRPERALALGLGAVDAVSAAHDVGVAHGWLSPDRVLVVPQQAGRPERVVVLGFGTAAAQDGAPAPGVVPADPSRAPSPFWSPERAAGGPPTLRGDVFSLGSVFWSMLSGEAPPLVRASAPGQAPDEGPAEPGTVVDVLRRARAADRNRRYVLAAQMGAALRSIEDPLASLTAPGAPTAGRAAPPGVWRPSRWRQGALSVAGVAAAFALGWGGRTWQRARQAESSAAAVALATAPAPASPMVVAPPAAAPPPAVTPPAIDPPPAAPPAASPPVSAPAPAPALAAVAVAPSARPAPRTVVDAAAGTVARRARRTESAPPANVATTRLADATPAGATGGPSAAASTPVAGSAPASLAASAAGEVVAAEPALSAEAGAAGVRAGVTEAVAAYARAIEARDLAGLERVYPGMTAAQRRAWVTFFGSVDALRARLVVDDVSGAGATAQARVRGTYEYQNRRPHRAERAPVRFTATLARDAGGWRVRAVE